jgi:hypothetical protein
MQGLDGRPRQPSAYLAGRYGGTRVPPPHEGNGTGITASTGPVRGRAARA